MIVSGKVKNIFHVLIDFRDKLIPINNSQNSGVFADMLVSGKLKNIFLVLIDFRDKIVFLPLK